MGRARSAERGRLGDVARVCAVAILLAGCTVGVEPPGFILVSIDTLRADHLGCYGYARDTSPNLDRLAARSLRFRHAFAPSPWTLPSHVAMLTGRHPHDVGIVDYESAIPTDVRLLAEPLAQAGYRTAAFVDAVPDGFVGADRGFARGFDTYAHAPHGDGSLYRYDAAATVDAGIAWLEAHARDAPFFLFLHTKSVHDTPKPVGRSVERDAPYDKPEPYRSRFLPEGGVRHDWREGPDLRGARYLRTLNERIGDDALDPRTFPPGAVEELISLYDGGVYYVDEHLHRLFEAVERLGLGRRTLLIVTADHGEAFLDHRFFLHTEVYDPLLRVPLILYDPRGRVGVVDRPARLEDIVPTVLLRAGLPVPREVTGSSLLAPSRDREDADPHFSYFDFKPDYFYTAFAIREGRWKLVYHRRRADPAFRADLYDVDADPGESRPVRDRPERVARMLERLRRRMDGVADATGSRLELRPQTVEHLRALGYLE